MKLTPVVKDRLTTEGAAFGVGLINGAIANWKPTASLVSTLLIGSTSMIGSLLFKNRLAAILEGAAAGSFGSLGYSVPVWASGKLSKGKGKGALEDVREKDVLQLGAGQTGRETLKDYANAGSSLEF